MKKLVLCFALLGCTSVEEVPPVEYPIGFSAKIACVEHGTCVNVVTDNYLVRLYEISVEGEVAGFVTGETIAETLERLGYND